MACAAAIKLTSGRRRNIEDDVRDTVDHYAPLRRRRPWAIILSVGGLIVLALGWCGFWYFAAGQADTMLASWRAREASRGRIYACANQTIGGFPFRMEVRCREPSAELRDGAPPLAIHAKDLVTVAQVYQPTRVIAEVTGPVTFGEPGRAPIVIANWQLAQASLSGLPSAIERVSVVFDRLTVARQDGGTAENVGTAGHLELHLRQAPRLPQDEPALDLAVRLSNGTVPPVRPLAAPGVDAEISAVLHGVDNVAPHTSWQARLRELQAANARLEIKPSRVQQGDIVTVGEGSLALTPQGRLDGEIRLTVAGLEQLVTSLGLDQAMAKVSQNAADRIMPGLNLDKLLGRRGNAALAAAGVAMLGQPAELEGRKAVMLPLRFSNDGVFLGPLLVGQMPPLF